MDVLSVSEKTPEPRKERIETLLRSAASCRKAVYKSPGRGDDIRWKTEEQTGSALVVENVPVHVVLFADPVATP
jgi:hypothetical protein